MASQLLHNTPLSPLLKLQPTLHQPISFPKLLQRSTKKNHSISISQPTKIKPCYSTLAGDILDPSFIVDDENRPATEPPKTQQEVPVIDLAGDVESVVEQVRKACQEWGFFQVVNHGVPLHLLQGIQDSSKEFFELEMEEKMKVKRDEVNPLGYHDGEHTKNVRDWKEVYDFLVKEPNLIPASPDLESDELRTIRNSWPESPSQFRIVCQEFAGEMEKLTFKLLELISVSLGLPADRMNGYFDNQISFVRINHYPPCPFSDVTLGCGQHKDFDVLTILAQNDVQGLEVKRDGEWVPVTPAPDAYIINVGDICQVWSNEKYKSVEHRAVVNGEKERYSFAYFFVPSHDVTVKPLEELVSEEEPAKYLPYNWGKFYATRNRSDYKKQDVENIQIHHFRVPS
ncbi:Protein DMR6-LIKE OXYGENASE 2 [Linum perenne]